MSSLPIGNKSLFKVSNKVIVCRATHALTVPVQLPTLELLSGDFQSRFELLLVLLTVVSSNSYALLNFPAKLSQPPPAFLRGDVIHPNFHRESRPRIGDIWNGCRGSHIRWRENSERAVVVPAENASSNHHRQRQVDRSIFDAEKLRTFSGYERIPKEMLKKEMLIAVCELLDSILVISVPRLFF